MLNSFSYMFLILFDVKTFNEWWILIKSCLNESLMDSCLHDSMRLLLKRLKHISTGANYGVYAGK